MALTATVKTDLYRFFAIAFDAAPGVTYMTQLAEASAAGMTVEQIVEVFTTKPQFTATYPSFLTNGDFAAKLVENVVGGSAGAAAKAEAVADVEAALSAGWSRGKVIYQVFNNLASLTGDAKWGGTAAMMANQVAYAQYYTEVLLGDTTNLATLRGVIANVTPTTDITPAAINAVLNPPPVVVQPSYALSANAASADEGTSVLFTLTTANVAAGSSFAYTLGGVNSSDVAGGALTGVATVGSDGKAIIQVNLAADATTDGAKTLTVSVAGQTAAVAVNDTSITPVVPVPDAYIITATDIVNANNTNAGIVSVLVGDAGNKSVTLNTDAITPTNKFIVSGNANITLTAGLSNDVITVVSDGTGSIDSGAGNDTVDLVGTGSSTVNSGTGNDTVRVSGGGNNTINTGAGNDTVTVTGAGNNTINVGTGTDNVTGGTGNDNIVFGSGDLTVADVVNAGGGTDTVTISGNGNVINAANLVGVENLVLNGTTVSVDETVLEVSSASPVMQPAAWSPSRVPPAARQTLRACLWPVSTP
jgi:Ca2+-binding RTX toxin-like protein